MLCCYFFSRFIYNILFKENIIRFHDMSPITATTSKISNLIYLYIDIVQYVCGLDLSFTPKCSEEHGLRTQEVVNKTTLIRS